MEFMNNVKKILKNFIKWVLSNTIWTIISFVIPLIFTAFSTKNIFYTIKTKTYNIHLYDIIIVVIGILFEVSLIIMIIYIKNHEKGNLNESNTDIEEPKINEINYDDLDYYYESYHKHLTVYNNGNGILINSFTVIINNINAINEFKRELNISDAKSVTNFPKLSIMKKTKLSDRFNKFGFWHKCLNNKDLIKSVREYYWSSDSNGIDTIAQSNSKILKWIIETNPSSIEVGKPYDIVYIMSIPGMFPIENGKFSDSIANIKGTHGVFKSQSHIKHTIKNFKYTVSFENGLELYTKPTGTISVDNEKENLHYENDNNIIFDKYIFNTKTPKCNSVINIEWSFKDNTSKGRRKKGRDDYETKKRN